MAYRLTKGSVSVIRKDATGIKQAESAGFVLDGECDENGDLLPSRPASESKPKREKAAK